MKNKTALLVALTVFTSVARVAEIILMTKEPKTEPLIVDNDELDTTEES